MSGERDGQYGVRSTREPRGDMVLRGRKHEEQVGRRFQMREKLIAIGDDYWIEDDSGQRMFKVNGKAARVRDTWKLEDPHGQEVAVIRERKPSVRDAIKIEFGGREPTVKKALVGFRDASTSRSNMVRISPSRGTSSITNTRPSATVTRSPRCPRSGCGPVTPTVSRSATWPTPR
jgi:hypothetical protein